MAKVTHAHAHAQAQAHAHAQALEGQLNTWLISSPPQLHLQTHIHTQAHAEAHAHAEALEGQPSSAWRMQGWRLNHQ